MKRVDPPREVRPEEASAAPSKRQSALRPLAGLAIMGYGLLVLLGVTPHESAWAGAACIAVGAGLLAFGLPELGRPESAARAGAALSGHRAALSGRWTAAFAGLTRLRARVLAAVGVGAVLGVTAFNAATHSGLSPPEWALLLYGLALAAAAPALDARVGRHDVGTLVGWSFPVLLAPLSLFALNGITSGSAGSAAAPLVARLVVEPTAAALQLFGTPVRVIGSNMVLATPRGGLTLGVGLVCAGLYPMALFAALVALHGWRTGLPPGKLALLLASGLGGLWAMNIVRLAILARVGIAQGGVVLQEWHAHLGWALFLVFTLVFWGVALRRPAVASPASMNP